MLIGSMRVLGRSLAVLATATLLAACPKVPRPAAPEKPAVPAPPAVDMRGATIYEVNPQASVVHVLAYRGGTLARFGHNHVLTVHGLRGRIWSHPTLARSGFQFSFPVAAMIVDDSGARQAAGSDFDSEIPQTDRDGTRKNMLRAEVLDAERYPGIELKSAAIAGSAQKPQVSARITIRNVTRDVAVAPAVVIDGARIRVSGEFDIQQTDFGIKPFSAALGALQVQDRLHVRFDVVGEKH
jgi:hypothetical protein